MDGRGAVPGEWIVRADGVVVDPVALGVLDEVEDVVNLFEEQPLVLQRPKICASATQNLRSRDPFCPGERTRVRTCRISGWVAMKASNRNERNGSALSVTMVTSGRTLVSVSRG